MSTLSQWLETFNRRMAKDEVPYIRRPLRAWRDWCKETSQNFGMDDPEYLEIERWFEEHSPEGALAFPLLFQGAFYYDAYFWPVQVHLLSGVVMVTLEDALQGMPAITKAGLFGNPNDLEDLKALWADCLDYAHGFSELGISENPQEFWERLVASADHKLRSAVRDLCGQIPGDNASQSSREACEMFLKAFLARFDGLTEEQARDPKKYYHDLSKLLQRILAIAPNPIFQEAEPRLESLPEVRGRYAGKKYPGSELWAAYKVAQCVAAEVIRALAQRKPSATEKMATRF